MFCLSSEISGLTASIKCYSYVPSQASRLGDLGYIDDSGRWQTVLNIFDKRACQKFGIHALQLTHDLAKYITLREHEPFNEPIVELIHGGGYQIMTRDQLAKYLPFAFLVYI